MPTCEYCKQPMTPGTRGPRKRWCSRRCQSRGNGRRYGYELELKCVECGAVMSLVDARGQRSKRYCSSRCRGRHQVKHGLRLKREEGCRRCGALEKLLRAANQRLAEYELQARSEGLQNGHQDIPSPAKDRGLRGYWGVATLP